MKKEGFTPGFRGFLGHLPAGLPHTLRCLAVLLGLAIALPAAVRADEVAIQNGDHCTGSVLALTTNKVILLSATLGRVTLPRNQVVAIQLVPGSTGARRPATNSIDEVWMRNGDRLSGEVLSLTTNVLVVRSAVLGRVNLLRCDVASIQLAAAATHIPALPASSGSAGAGAATASGLAGGLLQLSPNDPAISDVRSQLLNNAGPEATKQFNDLLGGLMTGKLGVDDIRAQAQSVAAQARAMKKDLGNDPSAAAIDSYLEILDQFLQQTAPAAKP